MTKISNINIINHKSIAVFIVICIITVYICMNMANATDNKYNANINNHNIALKIADTPTSRAVGLMETNHLKKNSGMLFVFEKKENVSFWMKNMKIPLDMIFISDEKIVKIYNNVPVCKKDPCEIYPSQVKVDYVLEVNSGYCNKNNIKIGQSVKFDIQTQNRINNRFDYKK